MITIAESGNEKGSMEFYVTVTDAGGTAVIPESMKWTLTDSSEAIINNREQVEISAEDLGSETDENGLASTKILLYGDDLKITSTEASSRRVKKNGATRYIIIEATYVNEDGLMLPANEAGEFTVTDLPYIKDS